MDESRSDPNEVAHVSVAGLVALNEAASGLTLRPERIRDQRSGQYLSRFRGRGMEFEESRPYERGDDARHLHWRVMARTGKPFTKQFREERERPVFVWLDLRDRMFFGTRGCLKSVTAARAATLVAWAAHRHGDRVGGVIFSETDHVDVKPARGKAAALFLINRIAGHPAWAAHAPAEEAGEAARQAIVRLRRVARPGSLVILFSDFANLDRNAESNLAHLARHCELMVVQIYDEIEAALPPSGIYRLSHGADEFVLDTGDQQYRELYERRFAQRMEHMRAFARQHRISYLTCRTGQDPAAVLRAGFNAKRSL